MGEQQLDQAAQVLLVAQHQHEILRSDGPAAVDVARHAGVVPRRRIGRHIRHGFLHHVRPAVRIMGGDGQILRAGRVAEQLQAAVDGLVELAPPGHDTEALARERTGENGLTKQLAQDVGDSGITVNCICPGPINTGMTSAIPDDAKAEFARRRVALKRYADPEEVAQGTLSLVLPASSFITGVALPVDGGLTIRNA